MRLSRYFHCLAQLALAAIFYCGFGSSSSQTAADTGHFRRSFTDGAETITLFYTRKSGRLPRDTGSVGGGVGPPVGCVTGQSSVTSAVQVDSSTMEYLSSVCRDQKKRRKKRDLYALFPGTNYCGRGHRASSYDDLGEHRETDRCCRDHDYCTPTIPAFGWRNWVFNPMPYTMKSCQCDHAFNVCLTNVNTPTSITIKITFFYILGTSCFNG